MPVEPKRMTFIYTSTGLPPCSRSLGRSSWPFSDPIVLHHRRARCILLRLARHRADRAPRRLHRLLAGGAARGQPRHRSRGVAGEQGRQPAAFSKVAHTLRRLSRVLYQKHPTKRHSSPLRCDCGRMILSLRAIELNSSDEIGSLVASRKSAAFLPSNPVQKDGTSRAQHRAEPEQRQSAAFRKVINRGAPLW